MAGLGQNGLEPADCCLRLYFIFIFFSHLVKANKGPVAEAAVAMATAANFFFFFFLFFLLFFFYY